ncbi:MAG: GtrA family protein [Patescibacteria group bacterium]|jgi:putative flippase GtrA
MLNKLLKHPIAQHPLTRQFSKFVIIGFLNTGIDWAVFFALTSWIDLFKAHVLIANIISFACGFTSSFAFNRNWTFKSKEPKVARQVVIFLLINFVSLGISTLVLGIVYHLTQSRLLGKTLAVGAALIWNFLAGRKWAFKPSNN